MNTQERAIFDKLVALARRPHFPPDEEPWSVCPNSLKGSENAEAGTACTYLAGDHNAKVAALLKELEALEASPYRVGKMLARKLNRQIARIVGVFPDGCTLQFTSWKAPLLYSYKELGENWEELTLSYDSIKGRVPPYKAGMDLQNRETLTRARVMSVAEDGTSIILEMSPRIQCCLGEPEVTQSWKIVA